MTVTTPRNVLGFQPVGQSIIEFPLAQLEWEPSQAIRVTYEGVIGASYAVPTSGVGAAAKDVAFERVRFFAIDEDPAQLDLWVDNLTAQMVEAGRGRLWTEGAAGDRRWAWAYAVATPSVKVTIDNWQHLPVITEFVRLSDWYGEDTVSEVVEITETPAQFLIANPGSAAVYAVTFRLESSASNGFVNPVLTNLGNGHQFSVQRTGAVNGSTLLVDAGQYRVQYSPDGVSSWVNDYPNLTMAAAQVAIMKLQPGNNLITYDDSAISPNATLTVTFDAAYH